MEAIDIILKVIELGFTFVGLVFVIFGWIIPYKQSIKEETKRRKFEMEMLQRQWEKELIDKQISEFYGPISALLKKDELIFSKILDELGRRNVFLNGQDNISCLSQKDQLIWKHYVDTYKLPTVRKVQEIIEKNQHLIYKSEIPTCFKIYMDYSVGWELLDNQMRNGVPNYYEYHYSYNYPVEFNSYINKTLEVLLDKQNELANIIGYASTAF